MFDKNTKKKSFIFVFVKFVV